MHRFITILFLLSISGQTYAFPGSSLIHKITGKSSSSSQNQNQEPTGTPGTPQKKKSFFGKIKSGVSHAISAPQCTQSVCSDPYQFTPQKANYCLGTEGKARTNVNCAKVFLNGPLSKNPAYSQAVHFAQIAMQKGGSGLGKITGAVSKVHAIATCTAQKCGSPNVGRNDLVSCLGTPKKVTQNPNCATAYYNTHCAKLHFPQYGTTMPPVLPHGVEFCNTISQARGLPQIIPPRPGMVPYPGATPYPGMIPHPNMTPMMNNTGGCHGVLTYTLPPGSSAQPTGGQSSYSPNRASISANPYDTDDDSDTSY